MDKFHSKGEKKISEEFKTGTPVNVSQELKALREMIGKLTPTPQPTALSEPLNKETPKIDYREWVAGELRKHNYQQDQMWRWSGKEDNAAFAETIGGASAGSAIPEIWASEVFRCCPYPASAFYDAPYIKWHNDIKGKAGDTVHVITVARPVAGTAGCAEPASTAPTISAVAITLEEYQCSLYVCRDDLEDIVPDTITAINERLAECLDVAIDNAFIANLVGKGSTLEKGTSYISANIIAEAQGSMRSGTCEPVVFIIHPAVEARLMQDSQFVNAATYGDRSVITGGHIIQYLGLDIVVVPKGSLVVAAPGTYRSILLSNGAVHAAKKRDPTIETQYLVQTQRRYIYGSVRFGKSVVCNDGLLWVRTGA